MSKGLWGSEGAVRTLAAQCWETVWPRTGRGPQQTPSSHFPGDSANVGQAPAACCARCGTSGPDSTAPPKAMYQFRVSAKLWEKSGPCAPHTGCSGARRARPSQWWRLGQAAHARWEHPTLSRGEQKRESGVPGPAPGVPPARGNMLTCSSGVCKCDLKDNCHNFASRSAGEKREQQGEKQPSLLAK